MLQFFACSNLLDTGDGAGNDLIKPTPATRDRCDERGAGGGDPQRSEAGVPEGTQAGKGRWFSIAAHARPRSNGNPITHII